MLSFLFLALFVSDPAAAEGSKPSPKGTAHAIRAKALARAHADSLAPAPSSPHGKTSAHPGTASDTHGKPAHSAQPPGHGKPDPHATHHPPKASAAPGHAAPHDSPTAGHSAQGEAHGTESKATGHGNKDSHEAAGHGSKPGKHGKDDTPPKRVVQCGEIPRSATWKMPEITLNRTLRVPAGMTLWINPGTRILLGKRDSCQATEAPVGILVEGRIVIDGDAFRPVVIEPARGTKVWEGLTITGSSRIDHLRLRAARTGLRIHGSTNTQIRSSLIEGCVTAVQVSGGASPTLSHLVITKSQGAGLYVNRASPKITGSLFLQNHGIAAWFEGSGLTRFENNAFWGNLQGEVAGTKRWGNFTGKGPVTSDADGNLKTDPVLVGSLRDNSWKDSLARAGRRPKELPFGDPPWALSGTSPLRGKGPRLLERPWIRTDIGLYGLDQE